MKALKRDLIPVFETHGRSNEEIADFAADATRGIVDLSLPHGLDGFTLEGRFWSFGDIAVNDGYASGLGYRSDSEQHRRQEVVQFNCVGFGKSTHQLGRHDTMTVLGVGGECTLANTAVNAIDFFVPFESVGYDPSRHAETTFLRNGNPIGRVLNTAMEDVTRRLLYASVADGVQMVDNLCALVRDLVLSNRRQADRQHLAKARRMAIDRYIEENLSAALSARNLMTVFAVSRTSLFRMFKEDGGVDAYVTKRRLHRAFHGLSASNPRKGAVRNIAEQLGFFEASNFNRAFRREFGFPPSELVGVGQPGPKEPN